MKKIFIVFIAVMLIAIAYFVFVPTQEASEETSFGAWSAGIKVTYADGSTETLGINPPILGELLSGGNTVTNIDYILKAKATGEGYTGCEIDLTNMYVKPELTEDSASKWTGDNTYGSVYTVNLDSEFHEILSVPISASDVESGITSLTDGIFTFQHVGTIRFRGLPDGEWATANLPSDPTLQLSLKEEDPEPTTYTLTVNTNPSSCSVNVDGVGSKNSGTSGAVFTGLDSGSYYITVTKSGYIREQGSVAISSDKSISYTLVQSGPSTYTVTVKSNPSYCSASLQGIGGGVKSTGSNGAVFTGVTAGQHYLTVTKSGYIRNQGYISVNGDVTITRILHSASGQFLSLSTLSFSYEPRNELITPYYTSPDKYLGNPR